MSRDTLNKFKRQVADYESTFATYIIDKGLISKYINNSYKCKEKTAWKCGQNTQFRKAQFIEVDTQTVNKRILKLSVTMANKINPNL